MIKERIPRLGFPSFLALNKYIQEVHKSKMSKRNVEVETYHPVEARDLPSHLANKINIVV